MKKYMQTCARYYHLNGDDSSCLSLNSSVYSNIQIDVEYIKDYMLHDVDCLKESCVNIFAIQHFKPGSNLDILQLRKQY